MISPSIGRVVWYYPPGHSRDQQPWPALIAFVKSERYINLGGFRADGTPFDARDVFLVQEEDRAVPENGYATWMPYQQKVAAEAAAKSAIVPLSKSTS